MNIRTITCFLNPAFPVAAERLTSAAEGLAQIKEALQAAGYPVQTMRLATVPFPELLGRGASQAISLAQELEALCFASQIDYVTLGPARPHDGADFFRVIPDLIGATQNVFASALIADPATGVSLPAVKLAAEVIGRCAALNGDGFGNLRFAALANVAPGTPFFPAAYAAEGAVSVALGMEAAPLAVRAFAEAASLAEARTRLIAEIETHAQTIGNLVKKFVGRRGLQFGGLDFSLAPYPEEARSVGTALERLTGGRVGELGTLTAAAFVADTLDRAQYKRAGFSGLLLPVFEDSVLARRAAEGLLTVSDLLLYCSVCGTGLDAIPLPGNTAPDALAAVLMDVGALALRLNKPLTARLMPIPGKQIGDAVTFDFQYFAPSRVLGLRASGLGGLLAEAGTIPLAPRPR